MSRMPASDSFDRKVMIADAPLAAFSALEWKVVTIALREAAHWGGGRVQAATRWRQVMGWFTGQESVRPLADPRLEALRSFVCAVRSGHRMAERCAARLVECGFDGDQISAVRTLAAR